MKHLTRRACLHLPFLVPFAGLSIPAQALAQSDEVTLLQIEVDADVKQATAQILVDGELRGAVGPACTLMLSIKPGSHLLEYSWSRGRIGQEIIVQPGEVFGIRISQGPEIKLVPSRGPQDPTCA